MPDAVAVDEAAERGEGRAVEELGLRDDADEQGQPGGQDDGEGSGVPDADAGVQRRVRGLRRDDDREDVDAAVRRPHHVRRRYGLHDGVAGWYWCCAVSGVVICVW